MSDERLVARDARVCWHPYTQHATDGEPLAVVAARDAMLVLADGREVVDGISSWWACLHGHGRAEIVDAMAEQARRLDHVLFAGATHEPAVRLAEELVQLAPPGLTRVFFSDDGSTAVEVALKMVYQRHLHAGEPERRVFVALSGSYHGDTFGAMSVGEPDPFFAMFRPWMFEARRVRVEQGAIPAALAELGPRAAGVIVEPLLQGAAGMRVHSAELLREARGACDRHGVPLVADEVLTGFGRTGALFACEKAGIAPDVMALAKGLTGGTTPLAATLATEEIFAAFLSDDRARMLFHGHTFTAHAIGCAAASASIELCRREEVPARFEHIGQRIEASLRERVGPRARALDLRQIGGVVALDLAAHGESPGYLSGLAPRLRAAAVERGVLLRPLGNVLYALPPACTSDEQCEQIARVMAELVDLAAAKGGVSPSGERSAGP